MLIAQCALILVGLILVAPLLQSAPLQTDDGALHIYRTVALDRAIHDGLLYPRWFPDLAYGYGFPFFNFREPLGYYAIEVLHLIGLSIPLSLNLILAIGVILSGLAMMWWVSDIFDLHSGFVAGVLYMASPYMLIGPIERGNLPEVIALALLPLILFCFHRSIMIGGRKYFFASVLSYSALLLTHNISSLIFTPLLMAYGLWLIAYGLSSEPSRHKRYAIRDMLLTICLSLALTSFFWLPALAEGNHVQLYLTHSNRNNDYHFNFLSLGELFSGPGSSDPNLLNPPLRFMLGWPQIIAAAIGLLALRRKFAREQHLHVIAALIAAIAFVFMTLSSSLPLWDNLPLIRFIQFPWRFVGRAALPLALLGGAAIFYFRSRFSRRLAVALSLLLSIIVLTFATPLLYPQVSSIKNDLTINDLYAFEHSTGMIGIDPVGAYLPVTVQHRPEGSPLEADYHSGGSIKRFDRSTLPPGATILAETYGPNRASIDLSSPIGFRASYLAFDFPGWQVTLDQQPIPIVPSDPIGLITFDVPPGQHHLEVSFGSTPVRSIAEIVSFIALITFVVALIKLQSYALRTPHPVSLITNHSSPITHTSLLMIIPIIFILIKFTLIDAQLTPLRSTRLINDQIVGVSHPLKIDFGGQMRLLGYDISSNNGAAGESVRVDLYWRALTKMDNEYQTTVGLIDERGEVWSPKSPDRPRGYKDYPATPLLPATAYAIDSFELPIIPGTPPGLYSLFVEPFNVRTFIPLPAQADVPHPPQRPADALIGSIAVLRSPQIFSSEQLGIYNLKLDQSITPELKLLGANRDRDDVIPGESVLLTLFWQATQKPARDYALKIELTDEHHQPIATRGFPIGSVFYPTSYWNPDEQIIDLDRMRVPVTAPSGTYRWRLTVGNAVPIELGEVRVTAPDRSFVIPVIPHRIDQIFDHKITLLGYHVDGLIAANQQVTVTLYWRAEAEMDTSYKVFIHLLDTNHQPRAQADAIPLNGSRPTIGWQPGEILMDIYAIDLPADLPNGQYQITTGLYNQDDLVRLKLSNGDDHVELK